MREGEATAVGFLGFMTILGTVKNGQRDEH